MDKLKQKIFIKIIEQILRNINARPKFSMYPELSATVWSVGSKSRGEKPIPILEFELTGTSLEVSITGMFGGLLCMNCSTIKDDLANPNVVEDVRIKISEFYMKTIKPWIKSKPFSVGSVLDERFRIIEAI